MVDQALEVSSRETAVAGVGNLSFLGLVDAIERASPPLAPAARILAYQNWIAAGAGRTGDAFAAWYNMGVIYSDNGDKQSAALAYRQALSIKPNFASAAVNLGLALEATGAPDQALQTWSGALQSDQDRITLLNQQGRLLEQRGQLDEAERTLRRSLATDIMQPDAIQHWVHLRQKMASWPIIDGSFGLTEQAVLENCGPLAVLALTDDVELQQSATQAFVSRKTTSPEERLAPAHGYGHRRIRLGYLSSDFCRHAMSYLIAELFEQHDRTRFELFGYCSTKEDGSDVRQRVLASFDQVRLIGRMSDEQAARLIHADEIDILIDLNGLTAGSRIQILRWKPAPFQATYLGFVGPVPVPELDGLLCDGFVIPPDQVARYQPRPLPIGGLYQANDSRRSVAAGLTRADVGLPDRAFVLCCFCGHFKITQAMFDAWMSVLRRAPHAVLWLADDNPWSRSAMLQAACKAGIASERLLFATRCAPDIYMARLALADLFLDTFPYNAGTVASDAIRMRLPIVTLMGRSFASRMAARLLDAYGIDGGIATTVEDYVDIAVAMASKPDFHAAHRAQFTDARWMSTLGDSQAFARQFETSLLRATGR